MRRVSPAEICVRYRSLGDWICLSSAIPPTATQEQTFRSSLAASSMTSLRAPLHPRGKINSHSTARLKIGPGPPLLLHQLAEHHAEILGTQCQQRVGIG
jgi:hypothetical protein